MDNTNEVKVNGILERKEYITHNLYHTKKSRILLSSLSLIMFGFLFSNAVSGDFFSVVFISLFIASFFSGALYLLTTVGIKIRSSREYKSDPIIQREITYHFTDDGINQYLGRSTTYLEWKEVLSIYEHKEMFQLYISKNKAIVLPKRYFQSSDEVNQFKHIIHQHAHTNKVYITEQ
ncbi:YcxB family protein [Pontibacillus yanchengensis]|uniref:YcxB-like C-terminal domain-containing protein n=1 Tax=Pontibacillus yanchengensis Y32 TaxID=1385514 RepID=A0A0A2TH32_9BACI|nr:YcxB family protein [Pontibacillus yanchengensis]KGP73376.1 hypothetical protein N782_05360 [Pontibacillus yanchengensis Y32]